MAQLPRTAMSEDNSDTGGFTPFDEGIYTVEIVESEMKETKAKTGQYLEIRYKVLDDCDAQGRLVFDRLNLVNPNPVAVRIAEGRLNAICAACEKSNVDDSEELHGIPFMVRIGIEDGDDDFPAKNEVNAILGPEGSVPHEVTGDAGGGSAWDDDKPAF